MKYLNPSNFPIFGLISIEQCSSATQKVICRVVSGTSIGILKIFSFKHPLIQGID